jgi:hypothetical protein
MVFNAAFNNISVISWWSVFCYVDHCLSFCPVFSAIVLSVIRFTPLVYLYTLLNIGHNCEIVVILGPEMLLTLFKVFPELAEQFEKQT